MLNNILNNDETFQFQFFCTFYVIMYLNLIVEKLSLFLLILKHIIVITCNKLTLIITRDSDEMQYFNSFF